MAGMQDVQDFGNYTPEEWEAFNEFLKTLPPSGDDASSGDGEPPPGQRLDDQLRPPDDKSDDPPGGGPPGLNIENFEDRFPGYAYILKLGDSSLLEAVNKWIAEYQADDSEYWTTTSSDTDKINVLLGWVEQSDWYTTRDETERAALIMEVSDPGTWLKKIEENKEAIKAAARAMGRTVDDKLDELARTSMLEGWTADELGEELAQAMFDPTLQPTAGSIRALYNGLLGFANSQLTTIDADDLWEMAWGIKRGDDTLENAYQTINQSAATEWDLTDFDLNAEYQQNGTTMAGRLQGVRGTIARLWDLTPAELNLMDLGPSRLIVTEDGKRRLMNSQEAGLMARADDKFLDSSTFKDEVGRIGSGLMRMMS